MTIAKMILPTLGTTLLTLTATGQHQAFKTNPGDTPLRFDLTPVLLNEYNAVGSQKWLGNPSDPLCEGPEGETCGDNEDTRFGRIMGNGGDWVELLVVEDHLDLRGAELYWAEPDQDESEANGTNIWFGSGAIEQGIITFSDDPMWGDLRSGTLITIIESTTADGGLDTDVSFDPCAGDWWICVNSFDTQYITTETNLVDAEPGEFNTGNDMWFAYMVLQDNETFPPTGEGADIWGGQWPGGGINSREVMRFEESPCPSAPFTGLWDDGKQSTHGSLNKWNEDIELPEGPVECRTYQDLTCLRSIVTADCERCATIVLNEYNAVSGGGWLNGGDELLDDEGGQAEDTFFGRALGNGGNWFELVVITDNLDIRGWSFHWQEVEDDENGIITLSDNVALASLPAGTIVTITERTTAQGGLDSTINDGWININSSDSDFVASTSGSDDDHDFGDFNTSNDGWTLSVHDAEGTMIEAPCGEGASDYYQGNVGNTDVCRLRENPNRLTSPVSAYDDEAAHSTFGSPNSWTICPDETTLVYQDFTVLPIDACVNDTQPVCPEDVVRDGTINVSDLLAIIANWGGDDPAFDIDGSGSIDVADLLAVIGSWGQCN